MTALELWFERLRSMSAPRVLEIGTKGWDGHPARHSRAKISAANPAAQWEGLDLEPGDGVTIVGDLHDASKLFPPSHFAAVLCASVLEHVRRPWVVAAELAAITAPGGLLYLQSHQTFPYHPYPLDYFRFSREALGELFAADTGWRIVESQYDYPCKILPLGNIFPHASDWNFEADAWLNVSALIERL